MTNTDPLGRSGWLSEALSDGYGYSIRSSELLSWRHSAYQSIEVHSTGSFGNLLRIDGSFMASERDEFFYHENLVHVPACAHALPASALIVGGGDGGSAEELLKHNTIKSVKLVEIDQAVVDLSRSYLRGVNHGVMDQEGGDPRLEVLVADGFEYIQNSPLMFDLIILDLTDSGGPSQPLYTTEFYHLCAARLLPGGLLSLQVASPFAQADKVLTILQRLCRAFNVVRPYLVSIPLSGGQWMMACASQTVDAADLSVFKVDRTITQRRLTNLQHYNGHVHRAAMALPNFVRDIVQAAGAKYI